MIFNKDPWIFIKIQHSDFDFYKNHYTPPRGAEGHHPDLYKDQRPASVVRYARHQLTVYGVEELMKVCGALTGDMYAYYSSCRTVDDLRGDGDQAVCVTIQLLRS